jgi:hypothetical protein
MEHLQPVPKPRENKPMDLLELFYSQGSTATQEQLDQFEATLSGEKLTVFLGYDHDFQDDVCIFDGLSDEKKRSLIEKLETLEHGQRFSPGLDEVKLVYEAWLDVTGNARIQA